MTVRELTKFIDYLKKNGEIKDNGEVVLSIDNVVGGKILSIGASSSKGLKLYIVKEKQNEEHRLDSKRQQTHRNG